MFINKTGQEHKEYGINNQDYGFEFNGFKCVVDGCSEGIHSEVGAKLFCELFKEYQQPIQKNMIKFIFDRLLTIIKNTSESIRNYLCFTILYIEENEDDFIVNYCGDGFIIKQRHDNNIEFEKIDDGEYPKYYIYNYLPKESLKYYQDGVSFSKINFSKDEYKNIGVSTDGLRFIFNTEFENEFINLLSIGKISAIKRLINREQKHFKDDITISF
jgi:hypothetical protein